MSRKEQLDKLFVEKEFDIIIIGGGATGLGCAVDAAGRGYKTLLLEKSDFAKGTSSRSTKLVHGGVRYLAQGNIRLVREALLERGRLLQNAPHVCHTIAFVVPTYKWWQKWYYGIGLWVYEFLSGNLSLGKTKLLSKARTLNHLPDLSLKNLNGGVLYFDGQFDDSRLAVNLAQTAIEHGAVVINYCGVTDFIREGIRITGVKAKDEISGNEFEIKSKAVINATGVFADTLLQLAEGHSEKTIAPSQGIHLIIEKHFFRGNAGMMIPKTDDGRVLFAIPWYDKLLLGTTDTAVENITTEPQPLREEIDFIIRHFNRYTISEIHDKDVKSVFVGLRPLAKINGDKKTSVMPRDHVIKVLPTGLVHVTGGKWTTYRSMAEHTIDKVIQTAGLKFSGSKTKNLKIHGWTNNKIDTHLSVYGADAMAVKQMMEEDISLSEKIHPSYPYTKAEIKWFVENEMATNVEDILARRIRLLFLDARAAMEAAPLVASILASLTGNDVQWEQGQLEGFSKLANGYLL
ncbi:MAG: glycerol-3-phosphate dehydrogenase/oxidase [Bacteroidales bacterium]|nr:glycerol-3-phosphate dehydrogenase/oxidase [Bacteroidales bacterium]